MEPAFLRLAKTKLHVCLPCWSLSCLSAGLWLTAVSSLWPHNRLMLLLLFLSHTLAAVLLSPPTTLELSLFWWLSALIEALCPSAWLLQLFLLQNSSHSPSHCAHRTLIPLFFPLLSSLTSCYWAVLQPPWALVKAPQTPHNTHLHLMQLPCNTSDNWKVIFQWQDIKQTELLSLAAAVSLSSLCRSLWLSHMVRQGSGLKSAAWLWPAPVTVSSLQLWTWDWHLIVLQVS